MKISLLINMKMPTIVGISIFLAEKISRLAEEYEKKFITSRLIQLFSLYTSTDDNIGLLKLNYKHYKEVR